MDTLEDIENGFFADGAHYWIMTIWLTIIVGIAYGAITAEVMMANFNINAVRFIGNNCVKQALVLSSDRTRMDMRGYMVELDDYVDENGNYRKGFRTRYQEILNETVTEGVLGDRFSSDIRSVSVEKVSNNEGEYWSDTNKGDIQYGSGRDENTVIIKINFRYHHKTFFAMLMAELGGVKRYRDFTVEWVENFRMYDYDVRY